MVSIQALEPRHPDLCLTFSLYDLGQSVASFVLFVLLCFGVGVIFLKGLSNLFEREK